MLLQTVTISRQALLLASPHTCSRCMSILCKRQMPQIMRQYQARLYGSSVSAPTLYRLRSRGLIRLAGRDVVPLLQGLLTNDVTQLMPAKSHYSMMLNVQGRVMYDLLLYNVTTSDSETMFLMEFDSSHTDRLMAEIKKYKIRKKVTIDTVDDLTVLATISEGGDPPIVTDSIIQTDDPRVPSFGSRIVVGSLDMAAVQETEAGYHTRRLQWGIAEGSRDLPPGNCFPLESNLAYMNGVSFSKGCYLGQELTARTHHTGATRKRIMPLLFERSIDGLEFEEIVRNSKGKNVGKLRSTQGIYGIALLRMAEVAGTLTVNTKAGETISLTTTPPDWWPK